MKIVLLSGGEFPVLHIRQIGYSDDISVTHHGPGKRNYYIIHYVLRGKGYFNGHPVTAGQGFLIRPEDFEEYHADSEDPWSFLWVISDDADMDKIFNVFGADERNVFSFDYSGAVFEIVHRMRRMKKNIIPRSEMLCIFLELLSHHERNYVPVKTPAEKLYTDIAASYIKENLDAEITVNGLSEILGVSRPYLYKVFISTYGKSPKQYINDLRISQAKKLLTETDMTATEIGCSVGYVDVLCFSKFFSAKVGLSPTEYRRSKRKNEDAV